VNAKHPREIIPAPPVKAAGRGWLFALFIAFFTIYITYFALESGQYFGTASDLKL